MGRHELEVTVTEHSAACPVCGGAALIKSGHACGRQRWRCKGCGRQFTRTTPRGKPAGMKREAIGLYCTGLSLNAIGGGGGGLGRGGTCRGRGPTPGRGPPPGTARRGGG